MKSSFSHSLLRPLLPSPPPAPSPTLLLHLPLLCCWLNAHKPDQMPALIFNHMNMNVCVCVCTYGQINNFPALLGVCVGISVQLVQQDIARSILITNLFPYFLLISTSVTHVAWPGIKSTACFELLAAKLSYVWIQSAKMRLRLQQRISQLFKYSLGVREEEDKLPPRTTSTKGRNWEETMKNLLYQI